MLIAPKRQVQNLTAQHFGYWTVFALLGAQNGHVFWLCKCRCGQIKPVPAANLLKGKSKSCGCSGQSNLQHGETRRNHASPEYRAYHKAKGRCRNVKDARYPLYGGRGIEFRFQSFDEFLSEVGRRPTAKHSLDRIDVEGHYEPGNLRWATQKDQARNTRRNLLITYGDQTKCLSEWSEQTGIEASVIARRIAVFDWPVEQALTVPVPTTIDRPRRDLTNLRFTRLKVLAYIPRTGGYWQCICDCGKSVRARSNALTTGSMRSCGCLKREHAFTKIAKINKSRKQSL